MPAAPSTIRLGYLPTEAGIPQLQTVRQTLRTQQVDAEVLPLSAEALEQALLQGDIHLGLRPLERLPIQLPEDLCITALSARSNPADQLIRPTRLNAPLLLGLPEAARVGVHDLRAKHLLLQFRKDLQCAPLSTPPYAAVELLEEGRFEGLLLPIAATGPLPSSKFAVQELNPEEFVPVAGQGAWALLAHAADKTVRRWAQQVFHHPDTAELTNIERKVHQQVPEALQESLGVYCRRDHNGHFHTYAVCKPAPESSLRFVRFSSSTTHGLPEEIVRRLTDGNL